MGLAYANIGDFENAMMFCERAVAIDDKYTVSYSNLGMIHLKVFNRTTNPEELPKAFVNYKKAIDLDPKISAAHAGIGHVYLYEQDYDKAIQHLTTALKLQPEINHALYNLGIAYFYKGNKSEALFYFNKFKSSLSYPILPEKQKMKLEIYIKECQDES